MCVCCIGEKQTQWWTDYGRVLFVAQCVVASPFPVSSLALVDAISPFHSVSHPATAWGHAKNIPETLTWRIWHGGAASGAGNVIENGTASTPSFRSGNNTLRVTINAGKNAARTYALEVMGAWPVTHAAVEGHGAVEGVVYDTRSLQATVTVTLSEGSGSVVLSMDDSLQDETLLHTNYMGEEAE